VSVLLLAEHDNAKVTDATARALSAALQIDRSVDVLVVGQDCHTAAEDAATLSGVSRAILVQDARYQHFLAEALADLIVNLSGNYQTLIAPGTAIGKSVMPRVAAQLDVMQVTDVSRVLTPTSFERLIYAGNAIQIVEVPHDKSVLTIRVASFESVAASESAAPIECAAPGPAFPKTRFVGESIRKTGRPELTSARIVISGGRGMGSADNFDALIKPIADKLGAAIGASRAAVDSGFAPNDWQVGQTGKVVAPELYIAIGISGAIQHLAGMKDAKVIVAINKDEEAPIFQVADYGLVGDLFSVLPEFNRTLKQPV